MPFHKLIKSHFLRLTFIFTVIISLAVAITIGSVLNSAIEELPGIEEFLKENKNSKIYSSDGKVFAEFHAEQSGKLVPYKEMPVHLINAVVAIEDERFYEHDGIDLKGIIRALRRNILKQEVVEGGSTITQQLVKNIFIKKEKTVNRKIREALIALQLEQRWGKQEVLQNYLNVIYFGRDCYGIGTTAEKFFGKKPSELSLDESALLAGVIKSPIKYSPHMSPEQAKVRRDLVLGKMKKIGYISSKELEEAKAKPVKLIGWKQEYGKAPYFVDYLKQMLIDKYGANLVLKGGLNIYSTLDLDAQKKAEQAIKKVLDREGDPSAAIAAVEPSTGYIKTIVGGGDFGNSQFNLATQGKRQPGSAFKPFVLTTALLKGVNPDKVFDATPVSIPIVEKDEIWKVDNYEGTSSTSSTLREATVYSINAVYARLIMEIGPKSVVETARKLGIKNYINADPAITLGGLSEGVSPLEMASAYATLANNGVYNEPVAYTRITESDGDLIENYQPKGKQVISPSVAYLVTSILKDVVSRGTGRAAVIARPAAGKTGTNQDYRDAWFIGYTPQLSASVWVGYPDAQISMTNVHDIKVTGGSLPASIWSQFMYYALEGQPVLDFVPPEAAKNTEGYVKVLIDPVTMKRATEWCPDPIEIELESRLVPEFCTLHKKPSDELKVPDLTDLPVEEATEILKSKGLKISAEFKNVVKGSLPGFIFDQSPKPGKDAEKGSTVKVFVATR